MILMFAKRFLSLMALLLSVVSLPLAAHAESITLLQQFSAQDGAVDFLPGAWVSVWEDRKFSYYKFNGSKFIQEKSLPDILQDWKAFSDDVDYLDQIARKDYNPALNRFLPKLSKVKKVINHSKKGYGAVYICYTLPTTDSDTSPDVTDIYLAIIESSSSGSGQTYKLLKAIKLESEVSYGQMSIQKIGNLGRLLILYWGEPTADSSIAGMDVYKLE